MPEIPDEAVQIVAKRMFRRYESEYDAGHLSWRDFADDARADLEAAAPVLAEAWGVDPNPPSAAALRTYLRSRGWAGRPPGQAGSLFDLPGTSTVVAVLHEGSDDRRFLMETLKRVAEAEGRTPWQVARDIPEVPGDH